MRSKIKRRIGKIQARNEFSELVRSVENGDGAVEIIDDGKVAAVLMSKCEYERLCASAKTNATPKRSPRGLIVLMDDTALEDAARELVQDFNDSIRNSEGTL